mmetsp:Transcript_111585/g.221820  ORF Transcript_111585/g.221820 Transcript_111585/m.221820 type:complete len:80 (+) Transcript_111585:239-478(+)
MWGTCKKKTATFMFSGRMIQTWRSNSAPPIEGGNLQRHLDSDKERCFGATASSSMRIAFERSESDRQSHTFGAFLIQSR